MKFGFLERWGRPCAIVAFALAVGCSPKIGDKCSVSTDCSVQGDRLCDPTQPGGYCTVFNCEPDRCPADSVCVAFNEPSCSSPALSRRFQRTFCMATCGDCRAGYACTPSDAYRQIVDQNPASRTFCAVPASGVMPPPDHDPAVCSTADAGPLVTDGAVESAPPDAPGEGSAPDATEESTSDATDATNPDAAD